MQTFLPDPDFRKTSKILDYRRLGKQRLEAWDIYRIIMWLYHKRDLFDSIKQRDYLVKRYKNHPAVLMWVGYEMALCYYGAEICKTWIKKGYEDNMLMKFCLVVPTYATFRIVKSPPIIGNVKFHASHRSNLLFKGRVDAIWATKYPQSLGYEKKDINHRIIKDLESDCKRLNIKIPENYYKQFKWKEPDDLPYVWRMER